MYKLYKQLSYLLILTVVLLFSTTLQAEGSKDLYPAGAQGGRAYLRASTASSAVFPFPTLAAHYVYAEAGEQIALASSAQSGTTNRILLYGPNNSQITLSFSSGNGNIPNRTGELAGPRLPGQGTGGNRYAPIYHTATQTGIYRVEFHSTSANATGDERMSYIAANANWTQSNNSNYLAAWDISVAKQSGSTWSWQNGRVYTNVLNMDNPSYGGATGNDNSNFRPNSGFYGKFKVLTRDGYVYNVDNNGSQGLSFTFMVNNRGFHEPGTPDVPLYKSIQAPGEQYVRDRYHDPRSQDSGAAVTQKIFYNKPDSTMPVSSIGAVPGGTTWLRILEKSLNVSQILIEGVEGSPNQLGDKGAYIKFFNESGGDYFITVRPKPNSSTNFPERQLSGTSVIGENKIFWDGKDGNGNPLAQGLADVEVELKLRGAEVHFPYIDMELNHYGIIIELLTQDLSSVRSDKVYWDDSGIGNGGGSNGSKSNPINASHDAIPNGTSSHTNGHIWGLNSNRTQYTFGDNQGMDTWTFIEGDAIRKDFEVNVKIADLKISQLTADKTDYGSGSEVTFTIGVKNDGPSDVEGASFSFTVPEGYTPQSMSFDSNGCGTEDLGIYYDNLTRTYRSKLDLPAGCEIVYTLTMTVNTNAIPGAQEFEAAILRPNDVTDPDATNSDPNVPPTDPHYECANNGLGGVCNNIMSIELQYNAAQISAIADINQTPQNTPVNGNVLTNDKGDGLTVQSATYLDSNGIAQPLPLGTPTQVFNANGTLAGELTLNTDGSYTFIPALGYVGDVPISYTAVDENGLTSDASLEIKVIPSVNPNQNSKPIAQNDTGFTKVDTPLSSNVLANDSDPEGNPLTVTGATQGGTTIPLGTPTQVSGVDLNGNPIANAGSLTLNADGSYTFTPTTGFVGTINPITYTISDGNGGIDTAELFISVLDIDENVTFANDDANSAPKGETMNGNVLDNDTDSEGNSQTVTQITFDGVDYPVPTDGSDGVVTIPGKGVVSIDKDGNYTFLPEPDFVGTVPVEVNICDDGNPIACDVSTLYLTSLDSEELCFESVVGQAFNWSYGNGTPSPVTEAMTQPGTTGGFVFDIYELDNSFNMEINGVLLATQEIEFQAGGSLIQNIRFADGSIWEQGGIPDIWQLRGDTANPMIRVIIDHNGNVTMYGSKASYGPLFPLELFNGNTFNYIPWNTNSDNNIVVTQNVVGITKMDGNGYGQNIVPCPCTLPGNFSSAGLPTNIGITSLRDTNSDGWPQVREGAWIALESKTKGFVPNRLTTAQIAAIPSANLVVGMMVYNITEDCLQINVNGTNAGWKCFNTQGCGE